MFDDRPVRKACGRHALAGREYDHGCFACQRDHVAALQAWKARTLTEMQAVTVESIFLGSPNVHSH